MKQLDKIKDIGKHSISVINEIIDHGHSTEVEQIKNDEQFNSIQVTTDSNLDFFLFLYAYFLLRQTFMKKLIKIFGVAKAIATKWYNKGLHSIEDVEKNYKELVIANNKIPFGKFNFVFI